ncbi:MAG: sensor domain-containing diguanylate cyclase [Pseudomonadota bacterium]
MSYGSPSSTTAAALLAVEAKDLRAENQQLRAKLHTIVTEAQHNEQKMQRFQALELRLMGCNSLHDLIRVLVYDYRVTAKLDRVTLFLLDPDYSIRRILDDDGIDYASNPDLIFSDGADLEQVYPALTQAPYLGAFYRHEYPDIFPTRPLEPRSVALLPLRRRSRVVGLLNLGSIRAERFSATTASDFLERFAAVVAMCVENATHHARLKHLGHTDTLTNVANRRLFDQRLCEEISRAQRHKQALSCLFFDVDFFKKVNDTYGHAAGDAVLREVALVIKSGLRAADVLARYGGEEFAVILPQGDETVSAEIAERIRRAVEVRSFTLPDGQTIAVTISGGAATLLPPIQGTASQLSRALVDMADAGVFDAKSSGRNCVKHRGELNGTPK